MNELQAEIIRLVANGPITLADLITSLNQNWVRVSIALDALVGVGVIGIASGSPISIPTYYLNS